MKHQEGYWAIISQMASNGSLFSPGTEAWKSNLFCKRETKNGLTTVKLPGGVNNE
jgi:hypothetical protein